MLDRKDKGDKFRRLVLKDDKGGRAYQIFQLSPLEAIPFELSILKYIAAGFKDNAEGLQNALSGVSSDNDVGEALRILSSALASIDGKGLFELIKNTIYKSETFFGEDGTTDRIKITNDEAFNKVFEEYPEDILKLSIFIIKNNCRAFFNLKKFIPEIISGER